MATRISPNFQSNVDFGGFNVDNILNQGEEDRLKSIYSTPSYVPIVNMQNEFQRRYGAEQGLVQQQAMNDYEEAQRQAQAREEQAQYALAQRGLGQSPFAQSQLAPIKEGGEYGVEAARQNMINAAENNRAIKINNLRNQLSSQAISGLSKQFEKQAKEFDREFKKYQQSTERKYSDELRTNSRRIQEESQRAWERMELQLQRSQRIGSYAGKIIGGLAGIVLTAATGSTTLGAAAYGLGSGIGSYIGGRSGQTKTYRYI